MSETILDSYLLKLGAKIDAPSFSLFNATLGKTRQSLLAFASEGEAAWAQSGAAVIGFAEKGAEGLKRFQLAAIGTFVGITGAVVSFTDHVAMADQQYRFFAERMLLSKDAARALSWAMDDLGVSIDQAVVDPEAGKRLQDFVNRYQSLGNLLDKRFDANMQDIRGVASAVHLLEREFEVLGMSVVSQAFDKMGLGSGHLMDALIRLDGWIEQHIPQWSDEFSSDLVPILKDARSVFSDTLNVVKDLGLEFTNLVAVFSGDDSIAGATFDFHKFAGALVHVSHGVAAVVHYLSLLESILIRVAPLVEGVMGGALVGAIAGIPGGPAGILAGAGAGALGGGMIGGTVSLAEEWKRYHGAPNNALSVSPSAASPSGHTANPGQAAEQARVLAGKVASETGADPALIYAQWAHETKDFTSPALRDRNNLGGIRYPGSGEYRNFDSLTDSASYYEKIMSSRYFDALNSKDPDEFARNLKNGRGGYQYYEDKESNYAAGLWRHLKDYGGSSSSATNPGTLYTPGPGDYGYHGAAASTSNTLNIQPGAIQVNAPNSGASAKDIATTVMDHISEFWDRTTRNQIGTVGAGVSA